MGVSLTKFTDPMNLIQIAADVVPQPVTTAVKYDAILFAIVVVGLLTAPRRSFDHIPCHPSPSA